MLYKEIDIEQFWAESDLDTVNLNKNEIDSISNKFGKISVRNKTNVSIQYVMLIHGKKVNIISIKKNSDDWFYIVCSLTHSGNIYFKCDQLDGLIDCLTNLLSIPLKESYYEKLSEFPSIGDGKNIYPKFTKIEVDAIYDYAEKLNKGWLRSIILDFIFSDDDGDDDSESFLISSEIDGANSRVRIHLYKFPDEWFIVTRNNNMYKCDQWDGLMKCLKEIL